MADPLSFAIATVAQIGISYLFPSEGPRLKDLKMSASTYGAAIPWVFGATRVPGNMIWSLPIQEHKKKKGLGKGGAYNEYTYTCSFAMGFCKGAVTSISRMWADGKLIFDITAGLAAGLDIKSILGVGGGYTPGSQNGKYKFRFYNGGEDQLPDSLIESDRGAGLTPAFRGLAYVVFEDFSLTNFGNRVPQITAEVYVGSTTQSVNVSPIHDTNGAAPLPDTYVSGEIACDWTRRYAFLRVGNGLTQIDLSTVQAVQNHDATQLGVAGGITKLLGVTKEGGVIAATGDGSTLTLLDPYSMQATSSLALGYAPEKAVVGVDNASTNEVIFAVGDGGQLSTINASSMAVTYTTALAGSAPFKICAQDASVASTLGPVLWTFRATSSTTLVLSAVVLGGESSDLTITGTSVAPIAVINNIGSGGVIMFWSDSGQHYVSNFSSDVAAETWRTPIPGCPDTFEASCAIVNGKFGWVYDGNLYIVDTTTGSLGQTADAATGDVTDESGGIPMVDPYATSSSAMQAFDGSRGYVVCFSGMDAVVALGSVAQGVSVGTIVQRILDEAGLPVTQTDLTLLYAMPVIGYGWASGTDVKNILDELKRLYLWDFVEREGIMVAVSRAEPDNGADSSVETIQQNALGSSSPDATDFWQETRIQESDLPSQVSLTYMNIADNYETSVARSTRISNPIPTMFSRQQLALEMNVVMDPASAKAQVLAILYSQWQERVEYKTRLPWAYLNLDPTDVVNFQMNDGRLYNTRLRRTEIGADFAISIDSLAQDSGAYDGFGTIAANVDGGGSGRKQTINEPPVAVPFVMNTPLLRDQDDTGGSYSLYYTGLGNGVYGQTFEGGGLFRSTDNLNFNVIDTAASDLEWGSIIGTVAAPQCGPWAVDWKTKIIVRPAVSWFELQSITDDDLWNGANACVVGNEVLQFRDCVENADGTWTLSNLLRARRGTDYGAYTHTSGERFVFLSSTTITTQGDLISARGQSRYFKGVGIGRSLQEVPTLAMLYEPRDLMPYAVADIRRETASNGDIDITWARRTRLGGNMQDATGEVALSEATEAYEAYILPSSFSGDLSRGAPPVGYRRKYSLTSPTFTYALTDQGNDAFVAATDTLHIVIYQLSGAVGRGFPSVRDIAPSQRF